MPKRTAISASPPAKRAKTASATQTNGANTNNTLTNQSGDMYWDIKEDGTRRVTVNKFGGKWMVNIREYYTDKGDGSLKPGKKGISLPMDQYSVLLSILPEIESTLKGAGEVVPRPTYDSAPANSKFDPDEDDAMKEEEAKGTKKRNHEATSDEDSDGD